MRKTDEKYRAYVQILKEELVPAMGCTEPIARAYAAAKAREVLGRLPEKVLIEASGSIIKNVKSVIDIINDKKIPVVFYEELSEGLVAKMIAEETNAEAKVLYTIHNGNISGEEKDTYVSLMKKNIENIKLLVNDK